MVTAAVPAPPEVGVAVTVKLAGVVPLVGAVYKPVGLIVPGAPLLSVQVTVLRLAVNCCVPPRGT